MLWIHGGFSVLMVVSIRLWWDRCGELLALLAINHAATFAVLICLPLPTTILIVLDPDQNRTLL